MYCYIKITRKGFLKGYPFVYIHFFAFLLCTLYSCLSLLILYILVSNIFVVWEFSRIFCMWFYLALRTPFGKTTFTAAGVESPHTLRPFPILIWFGLPTAAAGQRGRLKENWMKEKLETSYTYMYTVQTGWRKERMKWNEMWMKKERIFGNYSQVKRNSKSIAN